MLRFVKKMLSAVLVTVMLVSALPVHAAVAESVLAESYSLSAEELIVRIEDTYDQAGHIADRRRFKGKCSSLVNCSILALGIQTQRYHGDGRDEYNLYEEISRTDLGYDVVCYDASEYTLEAALNAITENGTRDAYNLIVGFEGGRTATSSKYGHACFVHGIVDGVVYYSESYDLELAGEYYSEGEPIVCTVEEFAHYYGLWAEFEGAVHFDFPDETAPELTQPDLRLVSENGFTMSFQVMDNMDLTDVYARVWRGDQSAAQAVEIPVVMYNNAAAIYVDGDDFDGYQGSYVVSCGAADRKGNATQVTTVCTPYPPAAARATEEAPVKMPDAWTWEWFLGLVKSIMK